MLEAPGARAPGRRLGLGVLGPGEGRSIISAAVASDLWDVAELCDLNEALRRERCREFGVERHSGSLDEMLANPAVDAVGIYTPDHLHAEHVIRSCRRASTSSAPSRSSTTFAGAGGPRRAGRQREGRLRWAERPLLPLFRAAAPAL
jgi:hypothetical protein